MTNKIWTIEVDGYTVRFRVFGQPKITNYQKKYHFLAYTLTNEIICRANVDYPVEYDKIEDVVKGYLAYP